MALTEETILPKWAKVFMCLESMPTACHKTETAWTQLLGPECEDQIVFFKTKYYDKKQEHIYMFLEVSLYKHLANNVWQIIFKSINVIKQHTAEWSTILFFFH